MENGVAEKNNGEMKNKSKVASTLVFYVNGKCNYFKSAFLCYFGLVGGASVDEIYS